MAAWTTADDVIDSWIGDDAPDSSVLVDTWIGKAERLIRFNVPGIQARIDAAEVDLLENIKDVVAAMVTRVFRNPDGTRQISTGEGPFSESRTFGGDTPGTLELTDLELAKLRGVVVAGQAFTIDMIPSTSPFSPAYVPAFPWA